MCSSVCSLVGCDWSRLCEGAVVLSFTAVPLPCASCPPPHPTRRQSQTDLYSIRAFFRIPVTSVRSLKVISIQKSISTASTFQISDFAAVHRRCVQSAGSTSSNMVTVRSKDLESPVYEEVPDILNFAHSGCVPSAAEHDS